jgi:hypothetical protein
MWTSTAWLSTHNTTVRQQRNSSPPTCRYARWKNIKSGFQALLYLNWSSILISVAESLAPRLKTSVCLDVVPGLLCEPGQQYVFYKSPDFLRRTFIRNPYTRILSAWKSKILHRNVSGYEQTSKSIPDMVCAVPLRMLQVPKPELNRCIARKRSA